MCYTLLYISDIKPFANQLLAMPPKTSAKAAAKSGKATKTVAKGDKKKRKGKRKESYAIYIPNVFSRPIQSMGHNVCVFVVCQLRPITRTRLDLV